MFDENLFNRNGIKLTIQTFENMTYACGRYQFEPGLSIIDVMMWNSPGQIKEYLDASSVAASGKELALCLNDAPSDQQITRQVTNS